MSESLFDVENCNISLCSRFGLPPFSIFDTTCGNWLKRSREWKRLGIKSEMGRGDNLYNIDIQYDHKFGKCNPTSIDERYGRKVQGTSIFDPVLCELIYTWFMPKNGNKILDCFAGGSDRGVVASVLGQNLREEQIESNEKQFSEIREKFSDIIDFKNIDWICGDSLKIKSLVKENEKFDLLFSCPPYYDLEVYSENENDLSNLSDYEEFLKFYKKIIFESCSLLNDDSFACFVVGDIRDKKGEYRNFVGDTVTAFKEVGLHYYNEIILVNSCGSLPVRMNKQFNSGRKIGKRHQNVLVFYKGDMRNIKSKFGEVIIDE